MPKTARLIGIKSLWCYTFEEAARVTCVSKGTVRAWTKAGLPIMDAKRPHLIRGDDLIRFLKRQRSRKTCRLNDEEFYCLGCRTAREAADGLVDCEIKEGRAVLTALCTVCSALVYKPISMARLSYFQTILDLQIKRPVDEL